MGPARRFLSLSKDGGPARILRFSQNDKRAGFALVETLVAVALLATAVVSFFGALSTGSLGVDEHNDEQVAQQAAQTQLEMIKAAAYDASGASYPHVSNPTGYTVSFVVNSSIYANNDIQKITVSVAAGSTTILTVEAYKDNR